MFALKKILVHFILPPGIFMVLLIVACVWLLMRKQYKAGFIIFLIAGLMWGFSITPVSNFLLRGLESDLKIPAKPDGDVIVLLGGGVYDNAPDLSGIGIPSEEMMGRIISAVRLQKKMEVPIIVSGGIVFKGKKAEAPIVKRFLVDLGVPDNKIYLEDKSRDTIENARFTKKIVDKLKAKKPLLVTSAFHMKRSVMSFEKAGLEVIPVPALFRTWADRKYIWDDYLPGDFQKTYIALHEYLGLLFYKFAY